jgi:hypothetical protein
VSSESRIATATATARERALRCPGFASRTSQFRRRRRFPFCAASDPFH